MMKNQSNASISKWWVALLLLMMASITALFVLHFKQTNPKIAYVNSLQLLEKYEGMSVAKKEYQQKAGQWKSNIDTLSSELERSIKQYEKDRVKMTDKEKKLSEELLRNKQQQLVQYQQAMQAKAQEEDKKMTDLVLQQVNNYLKEYGKRHGYTIIFGANATGNIVYADGVLDITEEVVKGLNQQYHGQ